ncbi:MAG: serine/threonine-protein kinase [Thermoplasmataceae archaeon]
MTNNIDLNATKIKNLITQIRSDIKKVTSDKHVSKLSRKNISYYLSIMDFIDRNRGNNKIILENLVMVSKSMLEVSELGQKSKDYYYKMLPLINQMLREFNSDPEISRVRLALQEGNESDRLLASSAILNMSRVWKRGMENIVPLAYGNLKSDNLNIRKNIAGFLYFVSSNNPTLLTKYGLDLSILIDDEDPTIRGVFSLIALKLKDQRLVEKAIKLISDTSIADLSYLQIPPQTVHFVNNNMIAKVSDIAKDLIFESEVKNLSGSNIIKKSFNITMPERVEQGELTEIILTAFPILDLANIEIDLTQLAEHFSVQSPRISVGYLKAGERKDINIRVVPNGNGYVQSRITITNGRMIQDIPFEFQIKAPRQTKVSTYEEKAIEPIPEIKTLKQNKSKEENNSDYSGSDSFPEVLKENYSNPVFLGAGGFASVYKVNRKSDGNEIALKIPRISNSLTGESFIREINAWFELKHPNIVELYRSNVFPLAYIEMEYMPSGGLDNIKSPVSLSTLINIGIQILSGLEFAHSKSRIHSDLKPSNILIGKGGVIKIGDWGLSRIGAGTGVSSTFAGAFTPAYAAPEEISPNEFGNIDLRTDLYQVGVILYELATGALQFQGTSFYELTNMILNEEPAPFSVDVKENIAVEQIILKAIKKRKEERFQSASEFISALKEISQSVSHPTPDGKIKESGVSKTRYRQSMCEKNLQLLERDIESRDMTKIINSLNAIITCVAKDKLLVEQVTEIIDNFSALVAFSPKIDDDRHKMLNDITSAARTIINSG